MSLVGKVAVLTGGTSGYGYATLRGLARRQARIILPCRNLERGAMISEMIKKDVESAQIELKEMDLSSLKSVRSFVSNLREEKTNVDVLINNAAVLPFQFKTTEEGQDLAMGVNHLGHFVLTRELLDLFSPFASIVNISCLDSLRTTQLINRIKAGKEGFALNEKGFDAIAAYRDSKLANILCTYELQNVLFEKEETKSIACNVVFFPLRRTGIYRDIPLYSLIAPKNNLPNIPEPSLVMNLSEREDEWSVYSNRGMFFDQNFPGLFSKKDHQPRRHFEGAMFDSSLSKKLWKICEELTVGPAKEETAAPDEGAPAPPRRRKKKKKKSLEEEEPIVLNL